MSRTAEVDAKALELRRAGVPVARIQDECGFRTAVQVQKALERAVKVAGVMRDPIAVRDLELDRLDRLQAAVWVRAVKGDLNAIDRVTKLGELRMRWAGVAPGDATAMQDAFETTVTALPSVNQAADAALLAAGRRIASRIDQAFASGDGLAETKALYLVPHLLNVLRELGATPEARAALKSAAVAAETPNDLTRFRTQRGIGA